MQGAVVANGTLEDRVRRELPHLSPRDADGLARVLGRLVAALRPERIYVFGSQARGEATPDSDFDLLLVVPEADQPPHRLAQIANMPWAGEVYRSTFW